MKTRYLFLLMAGMWLTSAGLSAQGIWTQKANYAGIERWGAVSFSIGDKGYIVTGAHYTGGYLCHKDLWEYDPATNIWSQKANFGGVGRYAGTGFSIGTKGYVGWGLTSPFSYINDFWEYNSITNVWTKKADLGETGSREGAVGFSIGSKGYMGTGASHNLGYGTRLKDFYEYDPATNIWTKKANLAGDARCAAVGFSIGSKGYIGTGSAESASLNDFWEYNPTTNNWTKKANFGGGLRVGATSFSIGLKGYIGTGFVDGSYNWPKDFWEYSQENNTWTKRADFSGTTKAFASGFSIGTKGYFGCGATSSSSHTNDFWEYDSYCTTGPAGQISGNSTVCAGQNSEVYSVPVISNATNYIWLYSGTGATINGYGNSVTINFAANATSGMLTVFGTGSCGNGQVSPGFPITIEVGGWSKKADFPGMEKFAAVQFSIGSKGYIVTGMQSKGSPLSDKDLWEYDPATNIWTQKADFAGAARYGAIGFSIGTKGYVGWGLLGSFSYVNDFWEYDAVANVWTKKADLGTNGSREGGIGFSVGSKGYMGTGANHNFGYGTRLKDFYEYDPATNVWTKKADFAGDARCDATGFSIGEKGYIGLGMTEATTLSDFWEYNPTNNTWTKKANFGGGLRMCAVGFSMGFKGYVGTGFSEIYNNAKNDFWEYSPQNNTWTKKADCGTQPRANSSGFSIDNKGYIGIGRFEGGSPQTNDFWEFTSCEVTGVAGPIAGATSVCVGESGVAYSIPAITGATNYAWSYSGTGATINGTGNSISIDFATNATGGMLSVSVTDNSGAVFIAPDFPIEISEGGWVQKANYAGIPRWGAVSFSIGTKGYIVTGAKYDGGAYTRHKDLWEFDPTTNIWSQKADFGGEGRFAGIGFSIGTKGYVGFGLIGSFYYATDFWEYNSITNVWTKKADLGETGSREGAVGFSIGSKGYMGTGGSHNQGYGTRLKDFYEYNPATDVWTKKADFGGDARCAAVGFAIGTKGYIGTGNDAGDNSFKDFWEYDPSTNNWTKKADFGGVARISAVAFSIGSKGYFGTGQPYNTVNGKLKDFWEYSPANNTWTQKADFGGGARSYATGFSIGTKGYIGCGNLNGEEQTNDFWEFTSCEVTGIAGPIAGATSVCVGESGVAYSIPAITGATAYAWSYSGTGATINGTGNSITIDFATNATGGMLSVSVTDNSGAVLVAPDFPIEISEGGWVQKADYAGIPRWDAVSFSIGTKGYIVTGAKYDGGAYTRHKDLWEFDPTTNIWSQKADFGGEGRFAGIGFSIGTKGYVGFGLIGSFYYATDFWEYNSITNVWTKKADLGETGSREGAVGFSIGSKGYMGTGASHNQGYGTRLKDFYEYNPATDAWTKKADFGGAARCAAVGFSVGSKGYIGTGNNAAGTTFKDFWEFDPTNNSWTKKADFGGVGRISAAAFSIGSKGYIGTGATEDQNYGKLKDFWEYSPENDSWVQKADFGVQQNPMQQVFRQDQKDTSVVAISQARCKPTISGNLPHVK